MKLQLILLDDLFYRGTGPSLKCNGELSKITTKIGLLTADELAFAGYADEMYSSGNYLQENATCYFWWSLSPQVFITNGALIWDVYGGGRLSYGYVGAHEGVRPSISLFSDIIISGGSGTSTDPYVVE